MRSQKLGIAKERALDFGTERSNSLELWTSEEEEIE